MYAACVEKRGAKSYNNKRSAYAPSSVYPGETRGNVRSDYISAAKSPVRGSAPSTIIFF